MNSLVANLVLAFLVACCIGLVQQWLFGFCEDSYLYKRGGGTEPQKQG